MEIFRRNEVEYEELNIPIEESEFKKRLPNFSSQMDRPDKRARIKQICDLVEKTHAGGPILEVGSLPYNITTILKLKGYDVIGVDKNPKLHEEYIEKEGLDIRECDIEREELPFDRASFSTVIFTEVIEHLRINPLETLRRINRVMKRDGVLILSTPNLYYIMNIYSFLLGNGMRNMQDGYKVFTQLEEKGYPGHFHIYSTSELKKMLSNTGFEINSISYSFPPQSKRYMFFKLICEIKPDLKGRIWITATPNN